MIRMLATVVLTFWWGVCILTRPKETKTWEEFTWCISLPPEGYFSFLFLSLSFKQLSVFPSATPIPFSSSCSTVSFSDFYFTFDSVLFFLEKKIKASRNWACLCLGHCFVLICKDSGTHSSYWDLDRVGDGRVESGQKFQYLSCPRSPVTALLPHWVMRYWAFLDGWYRILE